jgi:hypothetical protein
MPEQLAAEFGHRFAFVRRNQGRIGGEQDGVASAIETGQIAQCDADRPSGFGDFDRAASLPVPGISLCAEEDRQWFPLHEDLEPPRRLGRVPGRRPITGADQNAILARRREFDVGHRIRDGTAQPVSHQNGEPIWSITWVSMTQPPSSSKLSASTRIVRCGAADTTATAAIIQIPTDIRMRVQFIMVDTSCRVIQRTNNGV